MKKKIYHIDCTLRDGGYYNSWNFDDQVVEKYLDTMSKLNIDYVEIGFRFLNDFEDFGPYACISEKQINKFKISKKTKLAVMINISEFSFKDLFKEIDKLFLKKKLSKISLIRIATHVADFSKAIVASNYLRKLGYLTAINLMQITEVKKKELLEIINLINKSSTNFFYIADSLGSMTTNQAKFLSDILKINLTKPFGIHAHDNIELALSNTILFLNQNASFVDSTIMGMGRGPGNTKTELLCAYLNYKKLKKYNLLNLANLIDEYFSKLKNKYKWGTNIYYYLSAKNKIHPTYMQQILSEKRYEENEILLAIDNLKKQKSKSYDPTILENAKNFLNRIPQRDININLFKSKKILLIANGESLKKYKNKISNFITKHKPVIISLNKLKDVFFINKVNYIAISHPTRVIADINSIDINQKLITPYSSFNYDLKKKIKKYHKVDYGLELKRKKFFFNSKYCCLEKNLVLSYILSLLFNCKVRSIHFAGLDGYEHNNISRKENNKIIKNFQKLDNKINFVFLTPSLYKL